MLEMDSFTLNTTAAYDFGIFEVNGLIKAINSNGRIRRLPLHFRQQDHPCSIDMIERYHWTLDWFLRVEMDSFTLYTTAAYHFVIFDGSWATNQLSMASLHLSFYHIGIGEPRVRLLILTTTKSLSFISNIDGPLTTLVSIFIWVDFRRIPSNKPIICGEPSSFGSTT